MNPVQIGFLILWMIVVLVWLVYSYLNYGQIRPLMGLRPRVKLIFIFQTLISIVLFALALGMIFYFQTLQPSFI